ncbi:MAG: DsrE family protein [Armatimonadota bacterium]|nr:DsrE family protein [Armatimonadota bacterium]MDR7401761.1 DsrE family protein [Armatimonadota bacterium]MDR7403063.1 DsrE family protein [Armatimonadota bacterium]MDR7436236.1 DsrE family protein [Armatimonadota bacterium]MDR7471384.1 DsrE family protein [Armatimonadota bacterium]
MHRVALIVLAGTDTRGDLGRVVNALTAARELQDTGDDVRIIFDGAGTRWIGELTSPGHRYGPLFAAVRDAVYGVCRHCAAAYGVQEAVQAQAIPLVGDYDGHPSLRRLLAEGFTVITF